MRLTKGDSYTIAINPTTVSPLLDLRVTISGTLFGSVKTNDLVKEGDLYVLRLTSEQTARIGSGDANITLTIETEELGVKKFAPILINVSRSEDLYAEAIADEIYDLIIPITITAETATVGTLLYDMLRGESAYQLAVDAGYTGTQAQWLESLRLHFYDLSAEELVYLMQPAVDAGAAVQNQTDIFIAAKQSEITAFALSLQGQVDAVISDVEATDTLINQNEVTRQGNENTRISNESTRNTAEGLRQTNTVTAILNAETATQNANTKAGLADEKAQLADSKATLADTAAQNADAKATLANNAATLANEKAGLANNAATLANEKAGLAVIATTNANTATANANTATGLANTAASNADTKATLANDKAILAQTAATNADNARLAIATDLEKKINTEDFYKIVNIGTGGLVSLKPTTKNFTYKLTVMANIVINIDLQKMLEAVGSARCRFIVDIPVARTITWMKPILWGGTAPTMTAGQYVFEIIDLDGTNTPLIWLVSSTTKVSYTGVKLYVDSTGADYTTAQINGETATRTTSTWAAPFKYLQNAINAATAGDVIFVKQGTYYPTHKRATTVYTEGDKEIRSATFTMKAGVDVYGGFAGTETYAWQRVAGNVTTFNGDLKRNATVADYAYNVVFANVASYTYLNGVTIINGNANAVSGDSLFVNGVTNRGGGINAQNANLVNISVTASGCTAISGGGYCDGTNYNCTASGCTATNGGGYYRGINYNCTASGCTANSGGGYSNGVNYNCTAYSNTAISYGGGWYDGTNTNCTCYSNTANEGGGWVDGTNTNCTAYSNTANYVGGWSSGTNTNCTSYSNTATISIGGWNRGTNINCTALNNKSTPAVNNIGTTDTHINCLLLNNRNASNAIVGFNSVAASGIKIFRNNAYDTANPTITGGAGSDINFGTCIPNLTQALAKIELPSVIGAATNETELNELKAFAANLITNLRPKAGSVLKGAGVNNTTYPNATDYEGNARPENSTIGILEGE